MRFNFVQKCALHLLLISEPRVYTLLHWGALKADDKVIHLLTGPVDTSVRLLERLVAGDAAVPHDGAGCGEC